MKKGLLAAALAAILTLSTLTACGGTGTDGSGQEDLPRLVIASDNYKPYSYVGPNGNLIGVDVDLATEACRRLGYAPEFCQIVWENKDTYLSSGQADCLWGSFTMTGREDLYQWAGPYLYSRQMVAVRANSDIHTLADLAGRRVAVQATGKPEALFLTSSAPGVSQVEASPPWTRYTPVCARAMPMPSRGTRTPCGCSSTPPLAPTGCWTKSWTYLSWGWPFKRTPIKNWPRPSPRPWRRWSPTGPPGPF